MFNWIKRFIQRIFTDEISKLRLDLAVSEQLQKSNAKMIDDLQKEVEKLKSSQDTTIGIQNKHDERIAENKEVQKDAYEGLVAKFDGFNDKLKALCYSTNAKESISSLYNKIAELKAELHKLRDGKVNENTQAVKELRKDIKHLTKAYYEAYKESTRRFYWLEDEVCSTDKKPNPEKLTLQLREKADNRFMLNAKEQIQLEIIRLLADQKLPMPKTELNRMVFQAVKGKFITKASVRLFIDELIEEGWLTETQEANIKWINVRG